MRWTLNRPRLPRLLTRASFTLDHLHVPRAGVDAFAEMGDGVHALLSAEGRQHVDRKAALVQVTDFPERLDAIGAYIETVRAHEPHQQDARPGADLDFTRGLRSHRSGDLDAAIAHYRRVLERSPRDIRVHNNLGLAYQDKGQLDEAAGHFQRALSIDAASVTARNNLAATLLGLGRPDYAAAELRRVLARDPANVDALVNLALAENAAGRPAAAHELLLRAVALEPHSATARYNLAVAYDDAGEPSRAIEHYRAFLDRATPAHAARVEDVRRRLGELTSEGCGAGLKPCATVAQLF